MNEMTTHKAFEALDIDVQTLESEIISNFQNKFQGKCSIFGC